MITNRIEELNCNVALIPLESFPAKGTIRCRVDRFEKKRLLLSCSQSLQVRQALTVEYEDMLILGEVVGCSPDADGIWTCLIKVEQVLSALQSLLRLRNQLLDAEAPARQPLTNEIALAA